MTVSTNSLTSSMARAWIEETQDIVDGWLTK